jgi:hypothetical protein
MFWVVSVLHCDGVVSTHLWSGEDQNVGNGFLHRHIYITSMSYGEDLRLLVPPLAQDDPDREMTRITVVAYRDACL